MPSEDRDLVTPMTRLQAVRYAWREGFPVPYIARIYGVTEDYVRIVCGERA